VSIIACSVDGCERPAKTAKKCNTHYKRFMKYGSHDLPQRALLKDSTCEIPECGKKHFTAGMCSAHYTRLKRTGSATTRKLGEVIGGKRVCATCGVDTPLGLMSPSKPSYCRVCVNTAAVARKMYRPVPKVTRSCTICAESFMGDKRNTKCCGAKCLAEYKRLQDIEMSKRMPRDIANARNRAWYEANKDTAFAAKARYRARKIAAHVEDVRREIVFERDGFRCLICTEPLRMDVKAPHPLTPSIDHIVPLSRGGAHSYANIQSAHLACNVAKGARIA